MNKKGIPFSPLSTTKRKVLVISSHVIVIKITIIVIMMREGN
jgi:hypothetical protein